MAKGSVREKYQAAVRSRVLSEPDLDELPAEQLERMHEAAAIVLQSESALAQAGKSVVGEMLRGQGDFLVWERYPKGDVFDDANHSHYFYHAHDPSEMAEGENGHFHLFVRPAGLGAEIEPVALPGAEIPGDPQERFVHIGAISVDAYSRPIRIFTTNAWVTNETYFRAEDVIPLLDHFAIEVTQPDPSVSAWVTAMVKFYRPQFEGLLRLRDEVVADWAAAHPDQAVLQDRRLQITSEIAVDIALQIERIEAAFDD